jgi:hypothetical protein
MKLLLKAIAVGLVVGFAGFGFFIWLILVSNLRIPNAVANLLGNNLLWLVCLFHVAAVTTAWFWMFPKKA